MNKKVLYTLSTAFLLSGLTACNGNNTDEGAQGNRTNDTVRPIGYYSDENVNRSYGRSYDRGNAILPERDNDGPITEMLDRAAGDNTGNYGRGVGNLGTRDDGLIGDNRRGTRGTNTKTNNNNNRGDQMDTTNNGNRGTNVGTNNNNNNGGNQGNNNNTYFDGNYTKNLGTNDLNNQGLTFRDNNQNRRGETQGRNVGTNDRGDRDNIRDNTTLPLTQRFSRDDYNYHGQMAGRNNIARAGFTNSYNGELSDQISNRVQRVNNVEDVRTIINGNDILVAVDTNDRNNRQVENQVRNAIKNLTGDRDVRVVTDENIFARARNIDNELRDGGPTEDLDADVRDMFRELGNNANNVLR